MKFFAGRGARSKSVVFLSVGLLVTAAAFPAGAEDDFYKGKTIRIVVGFSAGGGFDTYARALSRHLSKRSEERRVGKECRL